MVLVVIMLMVAVLVLLVILLTMEASVGPTEVGVVAVGPWPQDGELPSGFVPTVVCLIQHQTEP